MSELCDYQCSVLRVDDLSELAVIEQQVQLEPWTAQQVQDCAPLLHTGEYVGMVLREAHDLKCMVAYVLARCVVDEYEVLSVGVARQWQNRGLGRMLLRHWQTQLPQSIVRVHLEVRASNAAAIALYHGLGFVDVGRRVGYYAATQTEAREDARLLCWTRK